MLLTEEFLRAAPSAADLPGAIRERLQACYFLFPAYSQRIGCMQEG